MELKGFQNWSEQNPIYNNLMTLNWVQKAQENLVAEVVDRIRNAFWSQKSSSQILNKKPQKN